LSRRQESLPLRTRTSKSPEELRGDLLTAAAALFAARGFSDVGVADISALAGVATGTFYRYFPSKDDVLTQLRHQTLGELLRRAAAVFERADADDWWAGADAMVAATVGFWFEDRARALVVLRGDYTDAAAEAERALWAAFASGLRIGQRFGAVSEEVDPEAAASLLVHGALGLVYHALVAGDDPGELVATITGLARRLLQP
jgi:AcrR family transcriptional regulator